MNNYYIDKQNILTEEIKDAVRTMNQNVIDLSRENYYLQSKLNEIKNKITREIYFCIKAQIKRGEFEAASKGIGKYEKLLY